MVGIDFNVDSLGVGMLLINRPHVRNALNWSAMQAFAEVIEKAHSLKFDENLEDSEKLKKWMENLKPENFGKYKM